ncbi:MAG TPA: nicotinate-nucleotide adenylyltransferase [Candidatus Acidoferrales bacterium]|nr:nicotinate-nucleotide adenylyltransferase [Candidatus Acidoferrales bacterium]
MSEGSSARVGILGGTFNPPHIAHLIAAESATEQLRLDKMLFVPAAIPPHKLNEKIIPANVRLQMVKLAIKGNPKFEVCDIELKRSGASYSIDTIIELKGKFPDDKFFLVIGIDLLIDFYSWKDPEKILDKCDVVAMNRPGFALESVDQGLLRRVEVLSVPGLDVSSSDIRRRVHSGRSIRFLVPQAVEEYIYANSIYR